MSGTGRYAEMNRPQFCPHGTCDVVGAAGNHSGVSAVLEACEKCKVA